MKHTVAAALALPGLLLGVVGARGSGVATLPQGVVVLDTGSRIGFPAAHGAAVIRRSGAVRRILPRGWKLLAVSSRAVVAAVRSDDGPLWLGTSATIPKSNGPRCVAWSSNGRLLSYITGPTKVYEPDIGAWAYEGTLWVVPEEDPSHGVVAADGLFPTTECPAWSKRSPRLAYVSAAAAPHWALHVYRAGDAVAKLERAVPSISYRTFDWAPDRDVLVYADAANLYEWRNGRVTRLGLQNVLAPLERTDRRDAKLLHMVRFSPNGRYVAISEGGQTGVYTTDGRPVRVVPGLLNGWAGNTGVLTLSSGRQAIIELTLHPLDGTARLITKWFKTPIATDPAGRWFAYVPHTGASVVFRKPTGDLIRTIHTAFVPFVAAGIGGRGKPAEPISAY